MMKYCYDLMQRLGVEREAAAEISLRAITRSFDPGSLICGPSMKNEHWKVIISGVVATTRSLDARPMPLLLHTPGSWIDEEVLLPGEQPQSDYIALSDVDLMLVPAADVLRVASMYPSFAAYIIGEIAKKSRRLCEAILIQKMGTPLLRIVATMAAIAEGGATVNATNGAVADDENGDSLGLDLSQAALASLCGVSRTVLSHHLLLLKAAGMVHLRYKSIQLREREQWIRFLQWVRTGGSTAWILTIHDFLEVVSQPQLMAEAA